MAALPKTSEIYDRVMNDYLMTSTRFHNWWDNMYKQYMWESIEGANWQIDFSNGEIFIQ